MIPLDLTVKVKFLYYNMELMIQIVKTTSPLAGVKLRIYPPLTPQWQEPRALGWPFLWIRSM